MKYFLCNLSVFTELFVSNHYYRNINRFRSCYLSSILTLISVESNFKINRWYTHKFLFSVVYITQITPSIYKFIIY